MLLTSALRFSPPKDPGQGLNSMNVEFIVSLLGDDREGLIPHLEQNTHNHQGQWLANKFSQIDGQFAALIKVSVPAQNEQTLKAFFNQQSGMTARFSPVPETTSDKGAALTLNIEATDQLGIINKITQQLESLGVTIDHLECRRISIIEIGASLLSIEAHIQLAQDLSPDELKRRLNDWGERFAIKVK